MSSNNVNCAIMVQQNDMLSKKSQKHHLTTYLSFEGSEGGS